MSNPFFDRPILNSPYAYPDRHWELDPSGQPTQQIIGKRRRAEFITPIPRPKKRKAAQATIVFDEGKGLSTADQQYEITQTINALREQVDRWRELSDAKDWRVTPETERLLKHWRHHEFTGVRPFFCQVEAVETAIWLMEVAPELATGRRFLEHLENANKNANPELMRLALKLATGAGKTTVMAMLIAWQTVNAVRHPNSRRFTRGFLVVAPGLTIRDRLRVLQPNDPDSYYQSRELLPPDMVDDLKRAKIVITNYHAFKLRERLEVSRGTRALLQGHGPELKTLETEGQMLQRVMPELMGMKNVLVLNDEAHHCYRHKPGVDEEDLTGEDRKEAQKNEEAARLWISGLEAVNRHLGINRVLDLSATPFFLRGSGYAEGTLFPWTMSDFSLMDAIECGIVKLPRVPVADNIPGSEVPKFRILWETIRARMPRAGRGKARNLDPLSLPVELQTALEALYGHYKKTFEMWQEAGIRVPPCFIIVCQNTSISKLVYDFVSGFDRENEDGSKTPVPGRLELFRNSDEHGNPLARPRTLLIDSEQLESGEALDDNFRSVAADEIERFRREIIGADRRSPQGGGPQRPGPPPRGHEHGGQARDPGRVDPLRGLGVHAYRGVGRQHRDARAGRPGVRDAAPLRAGDRPRAAAAVLRPERGRAVQRRVRGRAGRPFRLQREAGPGAPAAAARDDPGESHAPGAGSPGDRVSPRGGLPRGAARRAAHGGVQPGLRPGADPGPRRPLSHQPFGDHRRGRGPEPGAPGGHAAIHPADAPHQAAPLHEVAGPR
jgi:type III restriction enzyme